MPFDPQRPLTLTLSLRAEYPTLFTTSERTKARPPSPGGRGDHAARGRSPDETPGRAGAPRHGRCRSGGVAKCVGYSAPCGRGSESHSDATTSITRYITGD